MSAEWPRAAVLKDLDLDMATGGGRWRARKVQEDRKPVSDNIFAISENVSLSERAARPIAGRGTASSLTYGFHAPAYRAEISCLTALGVESLQYGESEKDREDGS